MKSVCIMGGGLGGLMTGALLTKEGYRVTVLEKNRIIGGGLQSFSRKGVNFDVGMHLVGGMNDDGQTRRILRHLGIDDKIHTVPYNDTIVYVGGHTDSVTLGRGREGWIDSLCRRHGGGDKVRKELEDYVDSLYKLTDIEELFRLRPITTHYLNMPTLSAKEFIEQHISSPELRRDVAYTVPLYGGTADSPALLHATVSVLHIEGTHAFTRPTQHLADELAKVITDGGGSVLASNEVTAIEVDNGEVTAVTTTKGRYTADLYIGATAVASLTQLVPPKAFSPAFVKRIAAMPYSYSAFNVYLSLTPHTMRCTRKGYYISYPDTDIWNIADSQPGQWPRNAFMLTNADPEEPEYARSMTIICPMSYADASRFEGRKDAEYRQWKKQMAQAAIELVEKAVGPVQYDDVECASPLTLQRYLNTPDGATYGKHATVLNPALTTISPRTRLSNLFLTGQDINFHGMVGTSLTAVLSAEAIVGSNVIVNKINQG